MWNYLYLTATVVSLAAASVGCNGNHSVASGSTRSVLPVTTVRVKTQAKFSYPIIYYGRIQSVRSCSLSFEVPGRIVSLLLDEGENIKANQLMARLDTSTLEAEKNKLAASKKVEQSILLRLENGEREEVIMAARAMVMRREAETERAILDRNRIDKLRTQNATTQTEYEEALYGAKSLQASLDAAKARLMELESGTREEDIEAQRNRISELDAQIALFDVRIHKSTIVAPFTAHVMNRMVDEGTIVREGEPVFTVSEFGQYEARFSVPSNQYSEARAATSIRVGGNEVSIRDTRTIPMVSPETRTVDIIFHLQHCEKLIEGQTCTLTVTETVRTKCVELPISAIVPSLRGLWSCYRLEKSDEVNIFRIVREELTINHIDGDRVFAETSLPDDSIIVRDGVHKLVPGMLVHPKDDK